MNIILAVLPRGLSLIGLIGGIAALPCSGTSTTTVIGLGDVEWGAANIPTGLSNAVAISAGGYHSIALKADGTAIAWGNNNDGQASVPTGLSNMMAVVAGYAHNLALMSNGTVTAWGHDYYETTNVPPGLSNVVAIAAGGAQNLALKLDGTVVSWGNPNFGLLNVPAGLSNVVAIAAGGDSNRGHDLALRRNGTVVAWGNNQDLAGGYLGQTTVPAGLSNVVAIAAGGLHSLALKRDGTMVAWGGSTWGQGSVPPGLSNVVAIAAGRYCSLALKSDGTAVGWGKFSMNYGSSPASIPTELTNLIAVAGGRGHAVLLQGGESPVIVRQPLNQSTHFGIPVSLDIGAVGLSLRYQWQFAGENIDSATNASLTLTNPQAANAGDYRVVVTNVHGSATSSIAKLTLLASPPILLDQPVDQAVLVGSNVVLSVKAAGTALLDYQWRRYGTNLPGATDALLLLANVQPGDTGPYYVIVSNSLGIATSRQANLLVYAPPVIVQPPTNRIVLVGSPTTFTVSAESLPPVSFQWQFKGNNISGAAGTSYTINAVQFEDAGPYRVIVSNPLSMQASEPATLTVVDGPPTILANPDPQQTFPGGPASFRVVAAGSLPIHYQWRLNGVEIPDATNATLVLTQAATNAVGHYSVVLKNGFGLATSSEARLEIAPVLAWGDDGFGQITLPPGLADTVAIASGYAHNLALKKDRTVKAWGDNSYGQCQVPPGLSNVMTVAAGNNFSLVLKNDGTVVGWGYLPVPSGLSNVTAIAAGGWYGVALKSDRTVTAWGQYGAPQSSIPGTLTNVVAISAGDRHSLALKADGNVVTWRNDTWYTNDWCDVSVPLGLSNVVAIAAGWDYSLALKSDGTVIGWGCAANGALAIPEGLSNVTAFAAGQYHALALKSDGSLTVWGNNNYGQIAIPAALNQAISIEAGSLHSLALIQVWQTDQVAARILPLINVVGGYKLSFDGIPGLTYTLQGAEAVFGPWLDQAQITVGADGFGTWLDTNAHPVSAFYRVVFP